MPSTSSRSRTLMAGLCCTAAAAAVLTALLVWLIVAWRTFEPPPDMEGPSVFAAMLLVGVVAAWMGIEAVAAWLVFSDVLRRFPRGRATAVGLLAVIAVLHGLQATWLAGATAPEYALATGAVIPLAAAAAVLLARAPGSDPPRSSG